MHVRMEHPSHACTPTGPHMGTHVSMSPCILHEHIHPCTHGYRPTSVHTHPLMHMLHMWMCEWICTGPGPKWAELQAHIAHPPTHMHAHVSMCMCIIMGPRSRARENFPQKWWNLKQIEKNPRIFPDLVLSTQSDPCHHTLRMFFHVSARVCPSPLLRKGDPLKLSELLTQNPSSGPKGPSSGNLLIIPLRY